MIVKLLLYFGFALVDLDLVARVLAADVLRVHEVEFLEPVSTLQELRRRYVSTAIETGLPVTAQAKVAEMAWRYIAAAQTEPVQVNRKEFSFYT